MGTKSDQVIATVVCSKMDELRAEWKSMRDGAGSRGWWFRGLKNRHHLEPSLMRLTKKLSAKDHEQFERDVFYEFKARASDLRSRNLTDWEYLFWSRHYGLPTRVLDWTDTLAVALYFATIGDDPKAMPTESTVWCLNPYVLNRMEDEEDIVVPESLTEDDFGEVLSSTGPWPWKSAVAIYPIQINERVRAQHGWFTIHGSDRRPLDEQVPKALRKLILSERCVKECVEFLEIAGFDRYAIYPDHESLAKSIVQDRSRWLNAKESQILRMANK